MEKNALKLITYLRRSPKILLTSQYRQEDILFDYCYVVCGYAEYKYFKITIFKLRHRDAIKIRKSASTECPEYIDSLLLKYGL